MHKLGTLAWVFALLSILAVGGGTAVLPEMQHMTVHHYHWITDGQFRDIYSLGQVAPGPNMLMVMVIGYRLAGALGAAVVGLAFFLPDCILTLFVNRLWSRLSGSRWRTALQRGLAPISIGLMLSGTYAIARLSVIDVATALIALATFAILFLRRINPLLLISAAAIVYLSFTHW
jgi:chromate transporter